MATVPLFWKLDIPDHSALEQWCSGPGLERIPLPHVTLLYMGSKTVSEVAAQYGVGLEEIRSMLEGLQALEGREFSFEVTHVVKHPEMIVASATLPDDLPWIDGPAHITLARSPATRPVMAKQIMTYASDSNTEYFDPPITMHGVVALESRVNERAVGATAATFFAGAHLEVQTYERPTRQAEPRGYATFVGGEDNVQQLAERLAESARATSLGPPAYKFKVRCQAPGKPGDLYLKWSAIAGNIHAREIVELLEARLQQL